MVKFCCVLLLIGSILLIPVYVPWTWVATVWFVEGCLLILFARWRSNEQLLKAGWAVLALGLLLFLTTDWLRDFKFADHFYTLKYTIITIGSCVIAASVLWNDKTESTGEFFRLAAAKFKYFAIINAWLYLLHAGGKFYFHTMPRGFHFEYYRTVVMIVTNVAVAYSVSRIPLVFDRVVGRLQIALYLFVIVQCVLTDFLMPVVRSFSPIRAEDAVALAVLLVLNGVMVMVGRSLYLSFVSRR